MKRSHDASTRTSGLRFSRLRKPWQASKSQLNRARVYTLLVVSSLLLAALFSFASRDRVAASLTGNVIFALNNANQLLRFNAGTPGTIVSTVSVTGLQAGETLVGIDFRPANGQLYAMGVTGGSTGRLYTINTTSGAATLVGGTFALPQSAGVAAGTDYGFDFNPTVDRIRVVANSRDNFRLNPDTGTIAGAGAFRCEQCGFVVTTSAPAWITVPSARVVRVVGPPTRTSLARHSPRASVPVP